MKGVCTDLVKSVLLPLRLSTGMYAADAAIQKKIYGSGCPFGLTFAYNHINNFKWRNGRYNENR